MDKNTAPWIIDRLQSEKDKTIKFFLGIPREDLSKRLYSDGEQWSIHQILVHIVQAEESLRRLISNISGGGDGVPKDFNLDNYNHRKVHELENYSLASLLDLFSERRDLTIQMVEDMTEDDLSKEGRHPYLGNATNTDILRLMYQHIQLHQRDIKRFLSV